MQNRDMTSEETGRKTCLALAKGHLPSWERLELRYVDEFSKIMEAAEAGRLSHLKELKLDSVGKVAECVARYSTTSHPRACVTAFLRVVDELW